MIAASIDIGSNTALLLIAEIKRKEKNIIALREEQRIPRISRNIGTSGKINDESVERLVSVLDHYFNLIKEYGCDKVLMTGTSAFRTASNSEEIKILLKVEYGTEIRILSGDEEAELAFLGTWEYADRNEIRLVIDIGGGSTEIIYGDTEKLLFRKSFNAGAVSLSERFSSSSSIREAMMSSLEEIINKDEVLPFIDYAPDKAIALAGTPVTLACIYKGLNVYSEDDVEGFILTREIVSEISLFLSRYTADELLSKYPDLLKGREDLILSGSIILLYLMNLLSLDNVIVSTKGIRYGTIIKYLADND
jgi:exopolyphosphatase / guanosine-5'-triphosphate,3'-diphosphate pyrophosphatase